MPDTLAWAAAVGLPAVTSMGQRPDHLTVVIGSGGSFTVATALAAHLSGLGVGFAQPMTPLQYVQRADGLPAHRVLLISAEGKNRDILHAAHTALSVASGCDVLTFSHASPLATLAMATPSARVLCFDPPWGRDGYLATNSLLASIVLGLRLHGAAIDGRLLAAFLPLYRATGKLDALASEVARTGRLLALHGAHGLVAAIDTESKLSEAAFAFTQVSDFRQFAHGRHIQLARPDAPVPIIAFVSPGDEVLWRATRADTPEQVTVLECALPDDASAAAIAGLLAVMALVEKVAAELGQDPGQPAVPDFARRIHALDTSNLLPRPTGTNGNPKLAALEATMGREAAVQAGRRYLERLRNARFAALVLDFDGTMCETAKRVAGLDPRLLPIVVGLLQHGITIAFASGRGNSLHEDLRARLPPDSWPRCLLGCYSASLVLPLENPWPATASDPQLDEVQHQLESLGIRPEHGFKLSARVAQLTIRSKKGDGVGALFALCSSLVRGREGWRVFRSAHSVDVLAPAAIKTAVIDVLARRAALDPLTEVCRIGDRGELAGNDSELLAQGLGLSVDGVSADPASCWIFGEISFGPVERAAHYLGSLVLEDGKARFDDRVLTLWEQQLA
ncbi:MAG: hypothetical protein KF686_20205 [Ramlibacter sp.]|nr:hypothetical protein [Ramlibacter sp.]